MVRHVLNPPNWFTAASIGCSVGAVLLATDGGPGAVPRAAVLIVASGVFDLLDGTVARILRRPSAFGLQLDSIADALGFGFAPAVLAWIWGLRPLGAAGAAIAIAYVLAAAFRLARFNAEAGQSSWRLPGHTRGLSTTMAGGALATLVWVAHDGPLAGRPVPPWAVGALVLGLSALMVSNVPFRSFRDAGRDRWARALLAGSLGACLLGALAYGPSMGWGTGAALYLALGPLDGVAVALRRRRRSRAAREIDDDTEERSGEVVITGTSGSDPDDVLRRSFRPERGAVWTGARTGRTGVPGAGAGIAASGPLR